MTTAQIGKPINRVDGRAKVTGAARYAAEHSVPGLAYGVVVSSNIAKGRILAIDANAALELPGVRKVFTHENSPRFGTTDKSYHDEVAPPGSPFRPLFNDRVLYSGQPVALVVAESFELARFAASLVHINYDLEFSSTNLVLCREAAYTPPEREGLPAPQSRGNAEWAFATADLQIQSECWLPNEHHNPMEPFAATAVYEGGPLTVYDKTQGVQNVHKYLCNVFGYSDDALRVLSPFVGGAFGSGLRPQYHVFLAVLAAQELKRSVQVCLTRQQMFTFGYRPATWQKVSIGAASDGKLKAIIHEAIAQTSTYEDYSESVVNWSGLLYRCDNFRFDHKVGQLDLATPIDMRAPGAVWGVYALECAMDELAVRSNLDPIELRLRNHADHDQIKSKPFSSKELRECYRQGAERFEWSKRPLAPRSMHQGDWLIGWGMAGGIWEATQMKGSAKARLSSDGHLQVSSATADIGTGTYTIMTQIAADTMGLPLDQVTFTLGDSALPQAPVEGGSFTASTIGSAVKAACEKLKKRLLEFSQKFEGSPLTGVALDELEVIDGHIQDRSDASRRMSLTDLMRASDIDSLEEEASTKASSKRNRASCYAHSAVFAEVRVDEELGVVQVPRIVSAVAGGRVLNPKTARSQIMGGIVWGIGMALEEETVLDHTFGRFMTRDLANYHVPVHADINDIEVIFVEENDEIVNPLGVKGLGELGIVGVAAAIANAFFHATGRRIHDLPITPDKVMSSLSD